MTVHLAVAGDVFGGDLFYAVLFPHKMSWMRSGTELNQFLRIPTYSTVDSQNYVITLHIVGWVIPLLPLRISQIFTHSADFPSMNLFGETIFICK